MSEPAEYNLSVGPDQYASRRLEAGILIVLAVAGAVIEYPLAFALRSLDHSELWHALPFLGVTLVLSALIPLSLRLNAKLGLPGAPLLSAKVAGEPPPFSLRSIMKSAIGYAFLAAAAGASVLVIIILPLLFVSRGGHGFKLPTPSLATLAPGRIAFFGALVAVAAAISEEIQFRLVLYALLGWLASLVSRDSAGHPGRRVLWAVSFLQGYLFGLIHLAPLAGALFHSVPIFLVGGLVMPQTWEGVVFGRLYLRRGLEASVVAHATMDVSLFVFAAIGVLGTHLGK